MAVDYIDVWKQLCGGHTSCTDHAGRKMLFGEYGNKNSNYGWNIDHIKPPCEPHNGKDILCNTQPTNIKTNTEKGNHFPHWKANNQKFKAVKVGVDCYKTVKDK